MTPLMCLTLAVYFEARGEPEIGQYAVAEVIMNRVESPKYADTVCGVISEDWGPKPYDCQFSFMCDGKPEDMLEPKARGTALAVATEVLNHQSPPDPTGGAKWYHVSTKTTTWSNRLHKSAEFGKHVFFVEDVTQKHVARGES